MLERGKNRFKRFIFGRRAWPARVRSGVHRASNRFFEGETVNDQVSNDSPALKSFLKTRERVCNDRGREKLRVCRTFHLFAGAGIAEFDTFRPTRIRFRAKDGIGIFLERFTSAIEIFCRRRKRLFVLRKGRIKITRYEKSSKPRKMYPLEKAKSFLAVVSNDKSRK